MWCFEIYICVNYYNNQVKKKTPVTSDGYLVCMCECVCARVLRTLEVYCLS